MDIYPSYEFWENDLEVPAHYLLSRFQNPEVRKLWLDSLTGKQLGIIFKHGFNQQQQLFEDEINHDDISVQQKRKIIANGSDALFNYYLISYFDRTKLESAISEVARLALTQKLMELYLIKNNTKYDKRCLLFLLFQTNYSLLKSVYHFDKVQKRGSIAFTLEKVPRQINNTAFKDFISQEIIEQILKEDDTRRNDGLKNQFQGLFYHQNRIYLFIRRARDLDLVLNSNKVVHGHKLDWMILDFSLIGTQVNIGAKNSSEVEKIANGIVSKYFGYECVFINMQEQNFAAQVYRFLQACIEGTDADICIFEIKFRSAYFRDSNTTHLTLTIKPYSSMNLELDVLKSLTGSSMFCDISYVHSIRVMFHNKKVTLLFKSIAEYVTIYYLEHHLNKKEREELKIHMKQLYGLTILSKASC